VHSAIEIVGKARSDALTHTLIDFLMGLARRRGAEKLERPLFADSR
jgi:hypothetical protein